MKKTKPVTQRLAYSPSKLGCHNGITNKSELNKRYGQKLNQQRQSEIFKKKSKANVSPTIINKNKRDYIKQSVSRSPSKCTMRSQLNKTTKQILLTKNPLAYTKVKQNENIDFSSKYFNKTVRLPHSKIKQHLMNMTMTIEKKHYEKQLPRSITPTKFYLGQIPYIKVAQRNALKCYQ